MLFINPLQCECTFWSSMMLPCRHIIAVRKLNNLSLFDSALINERWTAGMKRKLSSIADDEHTPTKKNRIQDSVTRIVTPKKLSMHQKQSKLKELANEIVFSASKSSQAMYEHTMKILQILQTDLRQNTYTNFNVNKVSDINNKNNCIQDSLSSINLPSPIKFVGRQSVASTNIIIKKK
ncbi:uncharacterized protein LOC141528108 [Cotesia typhae]|uniref:uncharacterized protein LOC141528108 n=1 Tax=Cotesia typhae TaxID=2053667 RepID=UPI003D689586